MGNPPLLTGLGVPGQDPPLAADPLTPLAQMPAAVDDVTAVTAAEDVPLCAAVTKPPPKGNETQLYRYGFG